MQIQRILVPCDFSDSARAAFELARDLARRLGARLILAHAFFVPLDLEALSVVGVQPVFDRVEKEGAERLQALQQEAEAAGLACEVDARRGVPEEVILDVAAERHADLIVMGTTGRTGLAHWMLGSRAERVLRTAGCPVITVPRPRTA